MRFVLLYDHDVFYVVWDAKTGLCKSIPFFLSFPRALVACLSIFYLSLSLFFLFTSMDICNNAA